jgi:hypothetical protein
MQNEKVFEEMCCLHLDFCILNFAFQITQPPFFDSPFNPEAANGGRECAGAAGTQ